MLKVKLYSRANRERDVKMFYEALNKVVFFPIFEGFAQCLFEVINHTGSYILDYFQIQNVLNETSY